MLEWAKGTTCATLLAASFFALGAGPAVAGVTDGARAPLAGGRTPARAPAGGATVTAGGGPPAATPGQATRLQTFRNGTTRDQAPDQGAPETGERIPGTAAPGRAGSGVSGQAAHGKTTGVHGGGGGPAAAPAGTPVSVCGATAPFGRAVAGCKGGATGHDVPPGDGAPSGDRAAGPHDTGAGDQIGVPADALAGTCGGARAPADRTAAGALPACAAAPRGGLAPAVGGGRTSDPYGSYGPYGAGGDRATTSAVGPVNTCGSAAAVLGDATAGCASVIFPAHRGTPDDPAPYDRGTAGGRPGGVAAAPVDSCSGATTALGRPWPGCAEHCDHRHAVARELSELPQLPADAAVSPFAAVPANPGALPALPQLHFRPRPIFYQPADLAEPAAPSAKAPGETRTDEVAARTVQGAGSAAEPADAAPAPETAPASSPRAGGAHGAASARDGSVPGASPDEGAGTFVASTTPGGTADRPASPATDHRPADLPARLPGALPNLPPIMFSRMWHPPAPPAVRSLPDLPSVPVVTPVWQAGTVLPVHRRGAPPPVGGPPKFPPLQDAAAQPPSRAGSGALFALALAGLLAGTSGAISMVRRSGER